MQEAKKDGSYVPPPALETLSHMHKAERLAGPAGEAFRWLLLLSVVIFLTSAVVGLVMALRITKPRWLVRMARRGHCSADPAFRRRPKIAIRSPITQFPA